MRLGAEGIAPREKKALAAPTGRLANCNNEAQRLGSVHQISALAKVLMSW